MYAFDKPGYHCRKAVVVHVVVIKRSSKTRRTDLRHLLFARAGETAVWKLGGDIEDLDRETGAVMCK